MAAKAEKRSFYDSKAYLGYKKAMPYLYGIGASIVIIGALFKIQHYPGSGFMLGLGLGVEALIFFVSSFEKPVAEKHYHWENVFPEVVYDGDNYGSLDQGGVDQHHPSYKRHGGGGISRLIEEGFTNALGGVKIDDKLAESLNKGLNNLKESIDNLNKISSTAISTDEFNKSMSNAIGSANKLSSVYSGAADDFANFSKGFENATDVNIKGFVDQIRNVSHNLSALNSMYELQLQEKKAQEDMSAKMNASYKLMSDSLEQSAMATVAFKKEAEAMSQKMASLNGIYGNMLSAFQKA